MCHAIENAIPVLHTESKAASAGVSDPRDKCVEAQKDKLHPRRHVASSASITSAGVGWGGGGMGTKGKARPTCRMGR